jgi:hypothetical protein
MIELKGLEIEYYVHDEKCDQAEDLGMHRPLEEHDLMRCTLYSVSAAMEEPKCTAIICNGGQFQTPESYNSLKKRIEENKVNLF